METHDYGNTIDSNNNKHTGNKSDHDDIISTQCHHWYTSELLIDNKKIELFNSVKTNRRW